MRKFPPADIYKLIVEAVEAGIAYGYHRAYKYADDPSEEYIKEQLAQAVLNEICDRFRLE